MDSKYIKICRMLSNVHMKYGKYKKCTIIVLAEQWYTRILVIWKTMNNKTNMSKLIKLILIY